MTVDFDDYDSYAPLAPDAPTPLRRSPPCRARVTALALVIGAVASAGVAAVVVRSASPAEAATAGALAHPWPQMARPADLPAHAATGPTTTVAAT